MLQEWLGTNNAALDLLTASAILGGFLFLILLVRIVWMRILSPLVSRTGTKIDDVLLLPMRKFVLLALLLVGLHESIRSLDVVQSNPHALKALASVLGVAGVILTTFIVLKLFGGLVSWYLLKNAEQHENFRDLKVQASLVRKIGNTLIVAVGLLYLMRSVGLDISPLLASGAIGGLAVALAMQDSLSNLFAGFYLTFDKPIRVGDFIKLESGDEGFVEEIGWRNTKIRLWANNVVVIPNSKLSQSIITNYYLPKQEMSVYVYCGVSYDSDLQHVEKVVVDVAAKVQREVQGADTSWEPVVRWKEFGDFAITFVTVLRVREFSAQYLLQSEFIKALHQRFQEEGIEIPYPMRTVILRPAGDGTYTERTISVRDSKSTVDAPVDIK